MTNEQQFFLTLAADHVNGRATAAPETEPDWAELEKIGQAQNMCGIIYCQCRDFIPAEHRAAFEKAFRNDVMLSVCRREDMAELEEMLCREKIEYIPVKGSIVSPLYPVPQLRTMGDTDIVIHEADRERLTALMTENGFSTEFDLHVSSFSRDVVSYEFHDLLFYDDEAFRPGCSDFFNGVWEHSTVCGNGFRREPEASFHFVYLLAHLARHIVRFGCGFRQFMDIAVCVRALGNRLDPEYILPALESLGLGSFSKSCFALCERWFGVAMPFPHGKPDPEFYARSSEILFRNGVFGFGDESNYIGYTANIYRRSGLSYYLTTVLVILGRIFPSYDSMRVIPWYSFLNGRPWLLPFAWIYRFFYIIIKKPSAGVHALSEPFEKRADIEQRVETVSGWGL